MLSGFDCEEEVPSMTVGVVQVVSLEAFGGSSLKVALCFALPLRPASLWRLFCLANYQQC